MNININLGKGGQRLSDLAKVTERGRETEKGLGLCQLTLSVLTLQMSFKKWCPLVFSPNRLDTLFLIDFRIDASTGIEVSDLYLAG